MLYSWIQKIHRIPVLNHDFLFSLGCYVVKDEISLIFFIKHFTTIVWDNEEYFTKFGSVKGKRECELIVRSVLYDVHW